MRNALVSGLLDLLLPPVCAACAVPTAGAALCARCDQTPEDFLPDEPPPPALDSWTAAIAYEGDAREWVQRFKYPRAGLAGLDPAANAVARDWMQRGARDAQELGTDDARVLPIPLHPRRLRARGFNPAALLARHAARTLGAPLDLQTLRRVRDTPTQTALTRAARFRNMRGAFCARAKISGCVWLVDDVATTGATLAAAARALRAQGAEEIHAITLAWRP